MPVEFRCQQCQNALSAPDDAVGKKAKCPSCNNIQDVPAPTTVPPLNTALPGAHPASSPATPYAAPVSPSGSPYASPTSLGAFQLSPEQARSRLMLPAIFMAIMQGLFILLWGAACTAGIFEGIDQGFDTEDIVALSFFGVLVTVSIFIIGGCFCMIRQRVYWLCITAMVLGIISGLACLLPLPFGIWGLVVLLDSRVSAHFS